MRQKKVGNCGAPPDVAGKAGRPLHEELALLMRPNNDNAPEVRTGNVLEIDSRLRAGLIGVREAELGLVEVLANDWWGARWNAILLVAKYASQMPLGIMAGMESCDEFVRALATTLLATTLEGELVSWGGYPDTKALRMARCALARTGDESGAVRLAAFKAMRLLALQRPFETIDALDELAERSGGYENTNVGLIHLVACVRARESSKGDC